MAAEPDAFPVPPAGDGNGEAGLGPDALRQRVADLERRVELAEERRRALLHIMGDLNVSNRKLADQRKAMLHILGDYEDDRSRLARQTERLDNSRRALLHILKDSHESNLRLGDSRKATAIISHLRTFGRAAPDSVEAVDVDDVIERSLLLMQEQLRLRGIEVALDLSPDQLIVLGNSIQLEQVFINLLTNSRDALAESRGKTIRIGTTADADWIRVQFSDTGPGIPRELEQRIFDPFFTTKEVGTGTGLGLSITYSIVKEHGGHITVEPHRGRGANFLIELPAMKELPPEAILA